MEGLGRVVMLSAHVAAARRLRAGMAHYPEARRGLAKCARFHTARAATLAREICAGTTAYAEAAAPALTVGPGSRG